MLPAYAKQQGCGAAKSLLAEVRHGTVGLGTSQSMQEMHVFKILTIIWGSILWHVSKTLNVKQSGAQVVRM